MIFSGNVGIANYGDGVTQPVRMGRQGDLDVSELHGRFYEQTFRGNTYRAGSTSTALSANTITLTASTTPIVGVWNQGSSSVNLEILQAICTIVTAGNSAVAPGAFVWATSTGNSVISTGSNPFNCKTLLTSGSQAKAFNGGTALTGLTNNLVIQFGAGFGSLVVAQGATGTPIISTGYIENFDGSLLIPPGGVLALLNTTSSTTISVATSLVWQESSI